MCKKRTSCLLKTYATRTKRGTSVTNVIKSNYDLKVKVALIVIHKTLIILYSQQTLVEFKYCTTIHWSVTRVLNIF